MIEILLSCDNCGRQSDPTPAGEIDLYDYHDAPSDGVVVYAPRSWWAEPDYGMLALCPEHNTRERIEEAREAYFTKRRPGR